VVCSGLTLTVGVGEEDEDFAYRVAAHALTSGGPGWPVAQRLSLPQLSKCRGRACGSVGGVDVGWGGLGRRVFCKLWVCSRDGRAGVPLGV